MSVCRVITQGVLRNAIAVHNYPGLQNGPEALTGRWFSTDASKQQKKTPQHNQDKHVFTLADSLTASLTANLFHFLCYIMMLC